MTLTFTKIGVFVYHLKKLSGEDNLHQVFVKKFKSGAEAIVDVTDLKPATLPYNYKTEKSSGKIYYKVKNKFGIMLSY